MSVNNPQCSIIPIGRALARPNRKIARYASKVIFQILKTHIRIIWEQSFAHIILNVLKFLFGTR